MQTRSEPHRRTNDKNHFRFNGCIEEWAQTRIGLGEGKACDEMQRHIIG